MLFFTLTKLAGGALASLRYCSVRYRGVAASESDSFDGTADLWCRDRLTRWCKGVAAVLALSLGTMAA